MALEGRELLSTIVVNNPTDTPVVNQIDLRQAIAQANSDGGGDTIVFSSLFDTPQTITLTGGLLELSGTTAPTTITGPGANLLSVSGNKTSRVFLVDANVTASISGLTITGGDAGNSYGGGLDNRGTLSLTDCTVSSNNATYFGGGLYNGSTLVMNDCTVSGNSAYPGPYRICRGGGLANFGTATLTDCAVSGNSVGPDSHNPHYLPFEFGGGVYNKGNLSLTGCTVSGNLAHAEAGGLYNHGGTLTLTSCTVSGNSSADGSGGGLWNNYGTVTLTNCTVSDNKAYYGAGGLDNGGKSTLNLANCSISGNSAGSYGGGLYNGSAATLTDCTISGNSAADGGGLWNQLGTAILTNCTVSGNSAASRGGGLYNGGPNNSGTAALTSCTVSGNSAHTGGGGLDNTGTATLTNTIVAGNPAGGDVSGPISGSDNLIGGNPLLAPLGDYGGPTQTMPLLPGSPAIGTGTTGKGVPTTDQRGFNRGSTVDIGAFQDQGFTLTPVAGSTPQSTLIGTAFTNPLAVTVTANNTGQFVNPVDGGVITFTAPTSGASASLSATTATITGGKAGVTAAANATAGPYTVSATAVGAGQAAFVLKNFSLVVTTTLDETDDSDGLVSLREAIAHAQEFPGPHTITFDPAVFGTTPQTIILTLGPLTLTDTATTTIVGPGANLLSVSGNNASQVFDIEGGSMAISGLTVSGGKTVHGGGLYNDGGKLSLTDCAISGNAADTGGGVFTQAGGSTTLIDCTVSGNSSGNGGGLFNGNPVSAGSSTTLMNCTVSGNTAASNGGGLYNNAGGTMTLTDCTVSGNTAGTRGGGLYISPGNTATLTNTIVARNGGGDVTGALDPGSANNLVGIATGMTGISDGSQGNQVGTGPAPLDPLLAPLGDYGGLTPTMALLPGSPAIGGGMSGAGIPTADQRGQPRTGHVDIGAFQSGGFLLTSVAGSTPQRALVNAAFASPLAVVVTANDPVEPVDGGVIIFAVAPAANGASAALSADAAVIAGGEAGVTATANGTPGRYTAIATAAGAGVAAFALTNTEGSRLGQPGPRDAVLEFDDLASLRAAIAYANSHPGPETIIFDPADSGTKPKTIRLIGGPLVLTNPATTTIIGPGAKQLTITGGDRSRVFDIEGGSVAISGLTITGGRANDGGGLLNDGGTLQLTDVTIRGNRARLGGGLFNSGAVALSDVIIRGNTARVGSDLFNTRRAILSWRRSPAGRGERLGAPSIGGGTATGSRATDQRRVARAAPQPAAVGTKSGNPLAVIVTANNASQLVNPGDSGVIAFTAPTAARPPGGRPHRGMPLP
jgi:parallel beta-helix repeat protein